jgi:hypothetical protein
VQAPVARLVEVGRFDEPVYVTSPPRDTRLFVVERTGRIWVVDGGRRLPEPFLDLSRAVSLSTFEEGLLSVAFAPDYAASGRLYVDYTDHRHRTIVEEYRRSADPNVVDPSTARRVLVIENPKATHHGGLVVFGPDGYLYIGQGDGGLFNDLSFPAQRLDVLRGKMLRIDPRAQGGRPYGIPRDNPFVGRPGRDEIWAYGLRNPWRFAIHPSTGTLVIGDVGQLRVEEIDLAARSGLNFGWSCLEGSEPFIPRGPSSCEDADPPAFERHRLPRPAIGEKRIAPRVTRARVRTRVTYIPGEHVCSIVLGVLVRDPALPSLAGRYLHGDFCDPDIRSFRLDHGRVVDERRLGIRVTTLSSFGTDSSGHVYVTALAGPVYRLATPK